MTEMTGNRDTAWFRWVLVLSVTASRGNQIPTIFLNQLEDLRTFIAIRLHPSINAHETTPVAAIEESIPPPGRKRKRDSAYTWLRSINSFEYGFRYAC